MKAKAIYTDAPIEIDQALDAAIASGVRIELKDLVQTPKERINIMLDEEVVDFFKSEAKKRGGR